MEFPEAGKRCNHLECKQLDFLPIVCDFCKLVFCKDHSSTIGHSCPKNVDNSVPNSKVSDAVSYKCTEDGCSQSGVVPMLCANCQKHFCLAHRHHGCFDAKPAKKEIDKLRAHKELQNKVKAEMNKQVDLTLKAAQKKSAASRALANKLKLMKIKGKAVGDFRVPTTDRLYFLIQPPLTTPGKETKPIYLSKDWSIGKATDYCAKRLNIDNHNNQLDSPKLRLFLQETGQLITHDMDTILGSFINDSIIDGDSLVLEFIDFEVAKQCGPVRIDPEKYN
ncbi:AN1-type zinc finger protein 1 [Nilaparvata lugens]|uniref:AN1-type zinc finger protein 1 n=1 Tax=Nilaparvata lugens TaxID=108931 RepID=UPI000B97E60F|nr:AN1-type zinc finger protein 1 [Nilaparvata lugens]XP_039282284.1 AN1-type zinc finger protein 1 [Nilaparvata lugens]XP_039282291.1 AN1-type zinc finger protein 1 [Nilaparvata lugens]XP_039282295.1 AN1-type zinc finger protein 1 [Nilaparvata lugens]